jgi:hypothetical protein
MAGSGEASRIGNTRALNAVLNSGITGGLWNPPGDQVAALSATLSTGAQTTASTAASGGGAIFTKAIPDGAQLFIVDATGALDTMEMVCVNGGIAISATSFTFDSQTIKFSHAAGALVFLGSFQAYLALWISAAPTDNGLGTEYAQAGYARQLVPWTSPTAADPPVAANQAIITWGPLSGANNSDVVGGCSLRDSLSGGTAPNQYAWWTFAATRTPNTNDSLQIAAAALTLQAFH